MARTVADRRRTPPLARKRLTWPADAPRVGVHLGVGTGLMKAARRARQIGCTAIQIFSDNPTAWRRRPELPADAGAFVTFCSREGIGPIAIHASYLINLAGSSEPFATQSRQGLIAELQRAPSYGATLVNTHIGSHRGEGHRTGLARLASSVAACLAESPPNVRLVLENSAGGGDNIGSTVEQLAEILAATAALGAQVERLAFCLDTAHLWGAGYDLATPEAAAAIVDRFGQEIGLDRLALVHLNDSKTLRGSKNDRHEHLGAGQMGPLGLGALLRDPRLRHVTFILESPGVDEGYDAVNLRRAWLLHGGAEALPILPPKAFKLSRRSTRSGPPRRPADSRT